MLIVLEGIDGCGKTTAAGELSALTNIPVISFPTAAPQTYGRIVRDYLFGDWQVMCQDEDPEEEYMISEYVEQALHLADKLDYLTKLTAAHGSLTNHLIVVRYWQSAMVYGSSSYGLCPSRDQLFRMNSVLPRGDYHLLLDVPAETSIARCRGRNFADRNDEAKAALVRERISSYRELWMLKPSTGTWVTVDATRPASMVLAELTVIFNMILG